MPQEPSQTESHNQPVPAPFDPRRLLTRFMAAAALIGLLCIPASTIQGANPLSSDCPAAPPPEDAAAAQWFPRDPQFALRAGRELLSRPDSPAALCYFTRIISAYPQDASFLLDLGDAYWGAGQEPAAIQTWEQGRLSGAESDEFLTRLRTAYLDEKNWEKAAEVLTLWLERHDDLEARYRLGLIRAALEPGDALPLLAGMEDAPAPLAQNAKSLEAVIRAAGAIGDPAYWYARTGEELIRLGEPALAVEALRRATEENPEYGDAYSLLGLAQETLGMDPGESYQLGVQYAPDSAIACLLYGTWLQKNGEPVLARWWLTRAWANKPGDWKIASALAEACFESGELAGAEDWLARAVESGPEDPDAWMTMASFYIEHDLLVEENGIPAARKAVLLAPENARALDLLGYGWLKAGDFQEAKRFFQMSLSADPNSPETHLHLALLFLQEENAQDAAAELNRVISLDPEGIYGAKAGALLADLWEVE